MPWPYAGPCTGGGATVSGPGASGSAVSLEGLEPGPPCVLEFCAAAGQESKSPPRRRDVVTERMDGAYFRHGQRTLSTSLRRPFSVVRVVCSALESHACASLGGNRS